MSVVERTAEIISIDEAKSLTPQQRWRAKIKANPEKYKDYKEAVKAKRRDAYIISKEGKEDKRAKVTLTENGRVCLSCNQPKSWDDFSKDIQGYNQKTATCLECRREKSRKAYQDNPAVRRSGMKNRPDKLKRLYGISSWQEVVDSYNSQQGLCANHGCRKEISLNGPSRSSRAVIDHDHETGKFRALLCSKCNLDLGMIEKDEKRFLGLSDYLNQHKPEGVK